MSFFMVAWSWMLKNPDLTAGFLTFVVLVIGLCFAYYQLRLMKKTEQAKLINNMMQYWDSDIVRAGRKALLEMADATTLSDKLLKYEEEKNFEEWVKLTTVGDFMEELGNFARQKSLDLSIIAARLRTQILTYYEKYKPYIDEKKTKQPTVYKHFIWLANKMKAKGD